MNNTLTYKAKDIHKADFYKDMLSKQPDVENAEVREKQDGTYVVIVYLREDI